MKMENKTICKVVQDLLPSYIEKLTSKETNEYIEKHLNECPDCQKIFENMKEKLPQNNSEQANEEIKYLKKFKNKLNILKIVLLIIIAIIIVSFASKLYMLFDISSKTKELDNVTNYYAKMHEYQSNGTTIIGETYYKDDSSLTTITSYFENTNNSMKITYYKNAQTNEKFNIIELQNGQSKIENGEVVDIGKYSRRIDVKINSVNDLWNCLKDIKNISLAKCNSKNCYFIETYDGSQIYIEKETGLPVREIIRDTVADYWYDLNSVEEQIIKPQI